MASGDASGVPSNEAKSSSRSMWIPTQEEIHAIVGKATNHLMIALTSAGCRSPMGHLPRPA